MRRRLWELTDGQFPASGDGGMHPLSRNLQQSEAPGVGPLPRGGMKPFDLGQRLPARMVPARAAEARFFLFIQEDRK